MLKNSALKIANIVGESGIFRRLFPQRVPVFMLHRVYDEQELSSSGAISARNLRSYLSYLARRGFRVLTMDELWLMLSQERAIPSKSVMFTIDDGFFDHFDVAAKVFEEFGFPLNFFVITGFLDQELWPWDDQIVYALHHANVDRAEITLPSGSMYTIKLAHQDVGVAVQALRSRLKSEQQTDLYTWLRVALFPSLAVAFPSRIPREFRPMSWDDARALNRAGHGVYPHTFSHRILSTLLLQEKQSEIRRSLARVRDELGFQPEVFAYPTGRQTDYDHVDIENLEAAGFKMAFNTVPGYVDVFQNRHELPRFSLPSRFEDFRQIVNRFEAFKMNLRD